MLFHNEETFAILPQVNFEDEARVKFLKLLGFSKDELDKKVSVRSFCAEIALLCVMFTQ